MQIIQFTCTVAYVCMLLWHFMPTVSVCAATLEPTLNIYIIHFLPGWQLLTRWFSRHSLGSSRDAIKL